jgi:hypothetical protein
LPTRKHFSLCAAHFVHAVRHHIIFNEEMVAHVFYRKMVLIPSMG